VPNPEPTPQAAPPVPQIDPQPLPTQVKVDLVTATMPGQPTQHLLRWDWTTPAGTGTFFSDRRFTQGIAELLSQHLQGWPAELIVPQPDLEKVRAALTQPNGKPSGR